MPYKNKADYLKSISSEGLKKWYQTLKQYRRPLKDNEIESIMGVEAEIFEKSWEFSEEDIETEMDRRAIAY